MPIFYATADERLQSDLRGNVKSSFEKQYGVSHSENEEWDIDNLSVLMRQQRTVFDKDGLLLRTEITTRFLSELIFTIVPIRENGKWIGVQIYDENGNPADKTLFTYISDDKIVSETFASDGTRVHYGKSIKENGRTVEQTITVIMPNGEESTTKFVIEYNEAGSPAFRKRLRNEEVEIAVRFKYLEFDAKGNWTKKMEYNNEDDTPLSLVVRDIEYF
jgi:hypothetical protein